MKKYESPWPPPKISLRNNWMKELGPEVARQAEGSQPTKPNPGPIRRTGRPVVTEQTSRSGAREINTRFSLDWENTNLFVERLEKDKDTDKDVDADRDRMGRPVGGHWSTQLEEIDIDFKVSGLPHAFVKQAENFRVRELVKKIESHPHRQALQADLQQNNAYNPFSDESKAMIREMGTEELFEFFETIPKEQCSECFHYWNQRVVYCTCGHLLIESESSQNFSQWRLDAFSIPHHVIRMGRPRGARHGKTEAQKEHFLAHNARKRCITKNFDGVHDHFQRDSENRDSLLEICWTEEKCIEMDILAQENHSYCPLPEEYERYKKTHSVKNRRR